MVLDKKPKASPEVAKRTLDHVLKQTYVMFPGPEVWLVVCSGEDVSSRLLLQHLPDVLL